MSSLRRTFTDRCLGGEALVEDIDDAIEQWHAGDARCSLPEFLGLTEAEYALFVENPHALKAIIYARRSQVPLADVLEWCDSPALAARARSLREAKRIVRWLHDTKRLH
jgi:hypothetical protein